MLTTTTKTLIVGTTTMAAAVGLQLRHADVRAWQYLCIATAVGFLGVLAGAIREDYRASLVAIADEEIIRDEVLAGIDTVDEKVDELDEKLEIALADLTRAVDALREELHAPAPARPALLPLRRDVF